MQRLLGSHRAEVIEAESAKFTAPMLLLHGLWSRAAVWRAFMGYLSHRGWQCLALERERSAAATLNDAVAAVREAIGALDAPPIVVGHDLGALLALQAADRARAVVALAPIVPPPIARVAPPALRLAGTWLQRMLDRPLASPRAYGSSGDAQRVGESALLVRALMEGGLSLSPVAREVPSVVWVAANDDVTSVDAARSLAAHVGAELLTCPDGGHDLPAGPGWEQRVSELHRWLVRRLGSSLLAFYEEEGERDS